eukprot:462105_1
MVLIVILGTKIVNTGTGDACCDGTAYDTSSDGCCYASGTILFDLSTDICCSGGVKMSFNFLLLSVIFVALWNTSMSVTCDGNVYDATTQGCCKRAGNIVFDLSTEACCDNGVGTGDACCDGTAYDTSSHGCCYASGTILFDLSTDICCDNGVGREYCF